MRILLSTTLFGVAAMMVVLTAHLFEQGDRSAACVFAYLAGMLFGAALIAALDFCRSP